MNKISKKRKINEENRVNQERWKYEYLITNNKGKIQCLVCGQIISVFKEFNVKRHYSAMHAEKYKIYDGESRQSLITNLDKKFKQQTGMFTQFLGNTAALYVPYVVAFELARAKKPFIDGNLIRTCAVKMAKSFRNDKIAEQFNSVPLSIQTIQRRTTDIGEQLNKSLDEQARKCAYFSLS